MTDDLVAWLREQLDRDEHRALRVQRAYADDAFWAPATVINAGALVDPARVLAEVQAKRRIIDLHKGDHECSTYDRNGEIDNCTWVIGDCSTLRLLALPYADKPGFRAEWAPDVEATSMGGSETGGN